MQDLQDDYQMSDKDMISKLKQEHEVKQVSDYKFPTEIIELPSRGFIYSKDNPLSSGKIEMKYMTAREEDILSTSSYIKDGSVLDRLFQSLIISNGEDVPIKYVDLVIGDKNAIMLAARVLGYGKDYKVEVQDPSSDKKQSEVIDLTQFENKEYDGSTQLELHKNEFKFTLPQSNRELTFMCLTESKERLIKHKLEEYTKANRKLKRDEASRELTTRMKVAILSIDDSHDQKDIDNFVDNELFAMDSRSLRTYMSSVMPDIDLSWEFISEETGRVHDMSLPIGTGFFWPDAD
jgi:hypothetical protein|tara:strand:- start:2676 stop:3551 length:876 start_codon:yes stop_codon:yes gene_type:complete